MSRLRDALIGFAKENDFRAFMEYAELSPPSLVEDTYVLGAVYTSKHPEIARALEADSDRVQRINKVPEYLAYTASTGNVERVKEMVSKGWDPKAVVRSSGWAIIDYAVCGGSREIREFLVERGAELEELKNQDRKHLLMSLSELLVQQAQDSRKSMAQEQTEQTLAWMSQAIEAGYDINAVGTTNETALHRVIRMGAKKEVVAHLLRLGADPMTRDKVGMTAAGLAFDLDKDEIFELCRAARAALVVQAASAEPAVQALRPL